MYAEKQACVHITAIYSIFSRPISCPSFRGNRVASSTKIQMHSIYAQLSFRRDTYRAEKQPELYSLQHTAHELNNINTKVKGYLGHRTFPHLPRPQNV